MSAFLAILTRDLRAALAHGSDALTAVLFFLLVGLLVPLGVGPDPDLLARLAPGMVWVAALLASLLALERLFQGEAEEGALELLALSPLPLPLVVLAKCAAHWLATGVPLLLATPVLGLLLGLPGAALGPTLLALLLGTPTLSLLGGVGAALLVGARRGGVLLALLVLPLSIPVLIFGARIATAAADGLPTEGAFLLLGSLLAAALPLCPLAAAAGLREALR